MQLPALKLEKSSRPRQLFNSLAGVVPYIDFSLQTNKALKSEHQQKGIIALNMIEKTKKIIKLPRQSLLNIELLESSVIGKQNTLVGPFLVTSTVATTSLVGYCQF